jgi:hypothetical protein
MLQDSQRAFPLLTFFSAYGRATGGIATPKLIAALKTTWPTANAATAAN